MYFLNCSGYSQKNYVTELPRKNKSTAHILANRSFSLSRNNNNKKLKTIQWKKLRNWDVIEDKKNKTLLQVLGLCVSPNFRYSSKCFAEI